MKPREEMAEMIKLNRRGMTAYEVADQIIASLKKRLDTFIDENPELGHVDFNQFWERDG